MLIAYRFGRIFVVAGIEYPASEESLQIKIQVLKMQLQIELLTYSKVLCVFPNATMLLRRRISQNVASI